MSDGADDRARRSRRGDRRSAADRLAAGTRRLYADSGGLDAPAVLAAMAYPLLLVAVQFLVGGNRLLFVLYRPAELHRLPAGWRWTVSHLPTWWHDLTRVTYSLVHDPSGFHLHLWTNALTIAAFALALHVVCAAVGWRRTYAVAYVVLAFTAPVVASFAYVAFGTGVYAWGASSVGFAFLGFLAGTFLARVRQLDPSFRARWAVGVPAVSLPPVAVGVPGEPLLDAVGTLVALAALWAVFRWAALREPTTPATTNGLVAAFAFLAGAVALPLADVATTGGGNLGHQVGFLYGALLAVGALFLNDPATEHESAGRSGAARP